MFYLYTSSRIRGKIVLDWSLPEPSFPGANWGRGFAVNGFAHSVQVQQPASGPAVQEADPVFAVTLFDCRGNLLGGSVVASLPGDVEVPRGINLRVEDLRPYFDDSRRQLRGRLFSLISAIWLGVRGERVRVGIYMERGPGRISFDVLDLDRDLPAMAAILESQVVALAASPPRPA